MRGEGRVLRSRSGLGGRTLQRRDIENNAHVRSVNSTHGARGTAARNDRTGGAPGHRLFDPAPGRNLLLSSDVLYNDDNYRNLCPPSGSGPDRSDFFPLPARSFPRHSSYIGTARKLIAVDRTARQVIPGDLPPVLCLTLRVVGSYSESTCVHRRRVRQ